MRVNGQKWKTHAARAYNRQVWLWPSGRVSIYSFVYHIYHVVFLLVKALTLCDNWCSDPKYVCLIFQLEFHFVRSTSSLYVLWCVKSPMAPSLLQPFRVSTALSRLHTIYYTSRIYASHCSEPVHVSCSVKFLGNFRVEKTFVDLSGFAWIWEWCSLPS